MTGDILPQVEDDELRDFVYDIPAAAAKPVSRAKGPAVRKAHTLKMRKPARKTKATSLGQLSAVSTHDDSENPKAEVSVRMQDAPLPEASDCTPAAGSRADADEVKPVSDDRDLVAIPAGDMKPAPLPAQEVEDQAAGGVVAVAPVAVIHEPRVQAAVVPSVPALMAGSGFPDGFSIRNGDIYVVQTKDGEPEEVFLCSPIRVIDRFRNGEGRDWGRRVGVLNPDGKEVVITVLDSDLNSSANKLLSRLTGLGLSKGSVKGAAEMIRDLLISWNPPRRLESITHQGWADKTCASFVLGEDRIIGNPDVIYLKPPAAGELPRYCAQGTLEEWKREVASRCVKNPLMMTAVSLAFVGPLLEVLNLQGGGLHLPGFQRLRATQRAADPDLAPAELAGQRVRRNLGPNDHLPA